MEKTEYFPRKKLFEEVQDLVASFYSKGNSYLTEQSSIYNSMLSAEGIRDDFYYPLLLMSMLSGIGSILKYSDSIIGKMNNARVRRKDISLEEFKGDIDIEEYVKRNYIDRVKPKEYPSIVKESTYQVPEYQLTLWILKHCEEMYHYIFMYFEANKGVSVFDKSRDYCTKLHCYSSIMQKRYGVNYGTHETYYSLKKKVIYRYRNRKVLSRVYLELIYYYERILQLKGIDFTAPETLEIIDHSELFDDRLFEIWLIKKSAQLLADRCAVSYDEISYLPLYEARKRNTYSAAICTSDCRIEILFQNRKSYMPKEKLKWYSIINGEIEEIGAIPDLVFLKYDSCGVRTKIVLVDAKNRMWTFSSSMQSIKNEVVQQIYIQDNFEDLFKDEYHSMLIAHNNVELQSRKFKHKDHPDYEIDVISLDFNEDSIKASLEFYANDLCSYLGV